MAHETFKAVEAGLRVPDDHRADVPLSKGYEAVEMLGPLLSTMNTTLVEPGSRRIGEPFCRRLPTLDPMTEGGPA